MTGAPGMGHNQPPEDLFQRAADLVANANKWSTERPEIANEEQAGACQLAIDQLRTVKEDLDAALKAERKPHDDAIAEIRARYRDPLDLIGLALLRHQQISTAWLQKKKDKAEAEAAERKRLAEEAAERAREAATKQDGSIEAQLEARRLQEEAERAKAAANRKPGRARVKGDYASKAQTLREFWYAEVTDEKKALQHYARDPAVRKAALEKALQLAGALARQEKRADAAPPGFRFFRLEKAV